jgi:gas vesicle protein
MNKFLRVQETDTNYPGNFLTGLLIGSLAGAAAALLFIPQSGKETRKQIQHKFLELRDQAATTVEDTVAEARTKVGQFTSEVNHKAKEIKQEGRDVLAEQLDRISASAETGKKSLERKHN